MEPQIRNGSATRAYEYVSAFIHHKIHRIKVALLLAATHTQKKSEQGERRQCGKCIHWNMVSAPINKLLLYTCRSPTLPSLSFVCVCESSSSLPSYHILFVDLVLFACASAADAVAIVVVVVAKSPTTKGTQTSSRSRIIRRWKVYFFWESRYYRLQQ